MERQLGRQARDRQLGSRVQALRLFDIPAAVRQAPDLHHAKENSAVVAAAQVILRRLLFGAR
jgi:hypothetical protein